MGIPVQASSVIHRPIEDVFAFISNMENSPLYGRTETTTKLTDGPISVGTKYQEEGKVMGRKTNGRLEITKYEPTSKFSYTNKFGNIREQANFTFEAVGESTRTSFDGEADMGRIGDLLAPLFSRMINRQMQSLFESIKVVLETPDGPSA